MLFLSIFFSRRNASHLSLDSPCSNPSHQSALQKQIWTVPVQQMSPISQNSKPENIYVIRPLWLLFCSCLDGGKLVNSFSTCKYVFVNSFVDFFRNLVNRTTFVYVSFA